MAENVAITAGSGTTIATDDCTINAVAVQVQRIKAGWGADSVYNDPAIAAPLPTQGTIETSQMSNLGTIITPLFVSINVSTSGDNSLIAAVTSKKIRVLAYSLVCDAAVAVRWYSGLAGTALSGAMSFGANGGISAPFSPVGHFETAAATLLNLNLSSAVGVRGHLVYATIA